MAAKRYLNIPYHFIALLTIAREQNGCNQRVLSLFSSKKKEASGYGLNVAFYQIERWFLLNFYLIRGHDEKWRTGDAREGGEIERGKSEVGTRVVCGNAGGCAAFFLVAINLLARRHLPSRLIRTPDDSKRFDIGHRKSGHED